MAFEFAARARVASLLRPPSESDFAPSSAPFGSLVRGGVATEDKKNSIGRSEAETGRVGRDPSFESNDGEIKKGASVRRSRRYVTNVLLQEGYGTEVQGDKMLAFATS